MTRRQRAEFEVAEYLLGLDALGLGGKAQGIYERVMVRDVRSLLLIQKALLESAEATGGNADADVAALDDAIGFALEGLLQSLKILWLTDGRGLEEHGPGSSPVRVPPVPSTPEPIPEPSQEARDELARLRTMGKRTEAESMAYLESIWIKGRR